MTAYHLPTKPYSIIDCINRIAAATGSVRYAQMASNADYNGHAIMLAWNDYRGYYVAEYYWGERVVIARGKNFADVLAEAKREFARQGLGASLSVSVRPEDAATADADPDLIKGRETEQPWFTWKHREAAQALRLRTDHLLLAARDEGHYRRLQGWVEVTGTWPNGQTYTAEKLDRDLARREWEAVKGQSPFVREA